MAVDWVFGLQGAWSEGGYVIREAIVEGGVLGIGWDVRVTML